MIRRSKTNYIGVMQRFPITNGVYSLFEDECEITIHEGSVEMKTRGNNTIYQHSNQFVTGEQVSIEYLNLNEHRWYYFAGHSSHFYLYH